VSKKGPSFSLLGSNILEIDTIHLRLKQTSLSYLYVYTTLITYIKCKSVYVFLKIFKAEELYSLKLLAYPRFPDH